MHRWNRWNRIRILAAVTFCVSIGAFAATIPDTLPKPKYLLRLSLNEFSILNASEADGLLKYGGSGDFQLNMAKTGSNVIWSVTVGDPRLMELLGIFVEERTVKLVQSLDLNKINPNQKIALEAIKSLTRKLEFARENPLWDPVKLSGTVGKVETNWVLETEEGSFKLVGGRVDEIKSREGKPVVADGFVKAQGEFELTRFIDKRENTLELFVMSDCPYGQKAEARLLTFLSSTNAIAKPRLEVHYIFYKQQKDGRDVFVSMHGETEITEDLVQMVIRDEYPQLFQAYLRLRASIGNDPSWKVLVGQIGLRPSDEEAIEQQITRRRDDMIRKEYDYAAGLYEITDGSPSYVWESERVPDLRKVAAFKGLDDVKAETCSN